jgi:hypothetical protein
MIPRRFDGTPIAQTFLRRPFAPPTDMRRFDEEEAVGATSHAAKEVRPQAPIRRFDVFAEVNRLKAREEGRPDDEAKGYGIWLAKVVAGRRFGRKSGDDGRPPAKREREDGARTTDDKFRHAGDVLQTDETFEQEIVERMGRVFYDEVFAPAVRAAVEGGQRYEQFRDSIRKGWKA